MNKRLLKKTYRKILSLYPVNRIKAISSCLRYDISVIKIHDAEKFIMPQMADITGDSIFSGYETEVPSLCVFNVNQGKCIIGKEEVFTKNNYLFRC